MGAPGCEIGLFCEVEYIAGTTIRARVINGNWIMDLHPSTTIMHAPDGPVPISARLMYTGSLPTESKSGWSSDSYSQAIDHMNEVFILNNIHFANARQFITCHLTHLTYSMRQWRFVRSLAVALRSFKLTWARPVAPIPRAFKAVRVFTAAKAPPAPVRRTTNTVFDDMDDDIPF